MKSALSNSSTVWQVRIPTAEWERREGLRNLQHQLQTTCPRAGEWTSGWEHMLYFDWDHSTSCVQGAASLQGGQKHWEAFWKVHEFLICTCLCWEGQGLLVCKEGTNYVSFPCFSRKAEISFIEKFVGLEIRNLLLFLFVNPYVN